MKKSQKAEFSSTLRDFANARGRPSIFLFPTESLDLQHVLRLRSALGNEDFDELDLVINSGGGSIHAAYQVIELLRLHAKRIYACVPFYAKSAATLLCLGADKIFVDELAQLGPLDTQIYEKKRSGQGEFTSALNPFNIQDAGATPEVLTRDAGSSGKDDRRTVQNGSGCVSETWN